MILRCLKPRCLTQERFFKTSAVSDVKTDWTSSTFRMSLPCYGSKKVEVEYGKVTLANDDEKEPAILAVHPSGSSYRQFSKLPAYVAPGYASKLVGLNMFGYGKSDPWDAGYRTPTLEDLVSLVDGVIAAEGRSQDWHFLGHSMGGGLLLTAAGLRRHIASRLVSLNVFEPNLFCLLTAGNDEEREMAKVGEEFFDNMLAAAYRDDWDAWGQTFYQFWFTGDWSCIDECARAKLVNTTLPTTIHEIEALKWGFEQGQEYAEMLLMNLQTVQGRKRFLLSHDPGPGSKVVSIAMANLLKREAGFEILIAPAGGHMGPVTHPQQVLPLLV